MISVELQCNWQSSSSWQHCLGSGSAAPEEQESEEEWDENHADGHSYRVQLLSDPEDTASEGSQIGNGDDADWMITV